MDCNTGAKPHLTAPTLPRRCFTRLNVKSRRLSAVPLSAHSMPSTLSVPGTSGRRRNRTHTRSPPRSVSCCSVTSTLGPLDSPPGVADETSSWQIARSSVRFRSICAGWAHKSLSFARRLPTNQSSTLCDTSPQHAFLSTSRQCSLATSRIVRSSAGVSCNIFMQLHFHTPAAGLKAPHRQQWSLQRYTCCWQRLRPGWPGCWGRRRSR
jgi:hypothetical protein